MRIALLTNEYPPHIYGGAGVHVEYLSRELARVEGGVHKVQVYSFGSQKEISGNLSVKGIESPVDFSSLGVQYPRLLDTLLRDLIMTGSLKEADIVHGHTWYTHFAGCLIRQVLNIPLVLTTHSLEPQRPWKAEQLGHAYRASTWLEKTAYQNADGVIAVSSWMKKAVQEVYLVPPHKIAPIPNGLDVTQYRPQVNPEILVSYGIRPDLPFILFVGRISRQKGLAHLVNAVRWLDPGVQIVLCAGAPDTPEIGREIEERIRDARAMTRNEIVWVRKWVPREHMIPLYSHASVFVCPSVYEPFGIINLEAMACGTPVVASAVGGIPDVVADGETGVLVPFEPGAGSFEPRNPEQFSRDLAGAVNTLLRSPEMARRMGVKSRETVVTHFSWERVAIQTVEFYRNLIRARS